MHRLARKLERYADARVLESWLQRVSEWKERDYPLMLMVHCGFFQSIGIQDGRTFKQSIYLIADQPNFIRDVMRLQGEYFANLTDKLLQNVEIDAAIFSEPIGGNHGALVSPQTYRELAIPGYLPLLEVLRKHGVETIIWRTYANTRVLLPVAVEAGMNCLWACECNPDAMDYLEIRREFGTDLRLIGGIDLDLLRSDLRRVKPALEATVCPLLDQGGYIPLADGRVREDISFQHYVAYRRALEKIAAQD